MNYETAKKLKDAGFPQNHYSIRFFAYNEDGTKGFDFAKTPDYINEYTEWAISKNIKDAVWVPTLSELIRATGQIVLITEKDKVRAFPLVGTDTFAKFSERVGEENHPFVAYGSTPEEAVAALWLELNKK